MDHICGWKDTPATIADIQGHTRDQLHEAPLAPQSMRHTHRCAISRWLRRIQCGSLLIRTFRSVLIWLIVEYYSIRVFNQKFCLLTTMESSHLTSLHSATSILSHSKTNTWLQCVFAVCVSALLFPGALCRCSSAKWLYWSPEERFSRLYWMHRSTKWEATRRQLSEVCP